MSSSHFLVDCIFQQCLLRNVRCDFGVIAAILATALSARVAVFLLAVSY
ncbi:hypothetical protein Q8W40_13945 [Vibrio penaeicida]|nr:hypothetical protein [Vibrio penaeicida]MDP2573289.1 hypothetical protein [Vibrio penaeicida]